MNSVDRDRMLAWHRSRRDDLAVPDRLRRFHGCACEDIEREMRLSRTRSLKLRRSWSWKLYVQTWLDSLRDHSLT
jgi:hypothetical protein